MKDLSESYEDRYRHPKNGEDIDYDCGCVVTIDVPDDSEPFRFEAPVSTFCGEHDPTLKANAPEWEHGYDSEFDDDEGDD